MPLNSRLTWLEYECARNVHIPAIACRLNALVRAYEWTDNQRRGLADAVKLSKLDDHSGLQEENKREQMKKASGKRPLARYWQKGGTLGGRGARRRERIWGGRRW